MRRGVLAVSLLLASCWGGDAPGDRQDQQASDLWGRRFVSVAVSEPEPRLHGARIEVTFERRGAGGVVRWHARCNTFGSEVELTTDRLVLLEEISGTDVGCPDKLHEQDRVLNDFFASNPHWDLNEERFLLRSGETFVSFRDRSA